MERCREREKRADRRAGGVIAILHNIHFRSSETDPLLDWQDFFREWKGQAEEQTEEQTEEEMFEMMQMFAASHPEGLSH